jgi:hypothetical protein
MAVSEVCVVSKVLFSISDGHYTESSNCSIFDEQKGRRTLATHVSYLRRRETCQRNAHLVSKEKEDAPTQCASHIFGTCVSYLRNVRLHFT